MKISCIQPTNYNRVNKNMQFKGYVNGHYYEDYFIQFAKKCMKNQNWENEMRAKKSTFLKDYLTAHDDDLTARILAGIFSFGTTEVVIAGFCALGAASDSTEEDISKVKSCIIDLLQDNQHKNP